jgi:hypothetical protein
LNARIRLASPCPFCGEHHDNGVRQRSQTKGRRAS